MVGICIKFESLVIVKLCVFFTVCIVSSDSSDILCVVAVSEGFNGCKSEFELVVDIVGLIDEILDFGKGG